MAYDPNNPTNVPGAKVTPNEQGGHNIVLPPIKTSPNPTDKNYKGNYIGQSSKSNVPTELFYKNKTPSQNEQTIENIQQKNLSLIGLQAVQNRTFYEQNKNTFPSFQEPANPQPGQQVRGAVYGRDVNGDINRSLTFSYTQPEQNINKPINPSIPTQDDFKNLNLIQKGLYNVGNIQESNTQTLQEYEAQYKGMNAPASKTLQMFGAGASSLGLGIAEGVGYPLFYPIPTAKNILGQFLHPAKAFSEFKSYFKANPAQVLGQMYGSSKLFDIAGFGGKIFRDTTIRINARDVGFENVLEPKSAKIIIEGGTEFPTVKSIKDSLQKFERGRTEEGTIKVTSTSRTPLASGPLNEILSNNDLSNILPRQSRKITVGEGSPELLNKRTLGIYASYKGGGSPYFFGIGKQEGYSFNIIPKLDVRPTVSIIEGKGILRIPTNILEKGVLAENKFLKENSRPGYFYLTGNSERNFNPKLPGWKTSEAEVVATPGNFMRSTSKNILGFDKRIEFMGRAIPIREYELAGTKSFRDYLPKFESKGEYKLSRSGEYYYSYPKNLSPLRLSLSNFSKYKSSNSLLPKMSGVSYVSPSRSSFFDYYKSSKSSIINFSSFKSNASRNFSYKSSMPNYKYYSSKTILPSSSSIFPSYKSNKSFSINNPFTISKIKEKTFGGVKKLSYHPRYRPSVEALYFGIRGGRVNKILGETGLVLRPIRV